MAPLRLGALALALVVASPARAQSVADWRSFVAEASVRFGVPVAWIERVMHAESAGRTMLDGRKIVSRAGAMGLMQLMPTTWTAMRSAYGLGSDPFDPHDNILAGTAYLRLMYDRFGYPGLFAAYNAGPGRYGDYLAGRSALPVETVNYVANAARAGVRPPRARSSIAIVAPAVPRSIFAIKDESSAPTAAGDDTLRPREAGVLFAVGGGR
ncbi:lytic transglycosylase domain-containing protein [Sphingomonas sp.]|jgi:soluble lytic murein transglycosylase-like protein|uniref:lytic transglycosylase domain-containing protein n=1 Tax=Sphingomonas sp. TaxID=28214 RepID=UPI002E33CA56|nr:lytic transglycosylase domain-containing protein [Sphingomonas sp.]HEX4693609.1 lytic transglycosylase domain-containing protein [Sphingomonas sp.]